MNKLYEKSVIERQLQRTKEIKNKINAHEKLTQHEIIEYINLNAYNMHSNDIEIKNIIESWISRFSNFLESTENALISSFPGQYIQRIFELAMAHLITKKFTLVIKKQENVDFIMTHLNQKYYFECATRNPSQMDKFYELLPYFTQYYHVAEQFKNKHDELVENNLLINSFWYEDVFTSCIWDEMQDTEKEEVRKIFLSLGFNSDKEILSQYNSWVYFNRYACLYFKNLIPEDLWKKYSSISFPTTSLSGENSQLHDCIFAIDRIVETIIDKLSKKYFSENTPITLSISIATFPEIIPVAPMPVFIEALIDHLPWKLTAAISKHKDKNKLEQNAKNLFAILIDTCWYNWLPSIAINRHGAILPSEIGNYYAVIYNENHLHMLNKSGGKEMFDNLVAYTAALPLSIKSI